MREKAVPKNDQCPVCYHERGAFVYGKVEGICEACVLRMMYAADLTIKGGSLIRQDGVCFCCHRQVGPDDLTGGACHFCRSAGLVFLGAHMRNDKINKQQVPAFPPILTFKKGPENYWSDPLKYLDMYWDVPASTEWEEDGADGEGESI